MSEDGDEEQMEGQDREDISNLGSEADHQSIIRNRTESGQNSEEPDSVNAFSSGKK